MLKNKIIEKLENQISERVYPSLKDLPKPEELKNNFKAARRILENLFSGRRMLIVGDYDADGIFATTILYSFLQEAGFGQLVQYLIPSRLKDGYGVSVNVIKYAIENAFDFIVTVDNGVAAVEAVNYANEHNMEIIITDHHTAPAVLPNVDIILNPRVPGETFPFTYISGATVAWYLVAALKKELKLGIDIRKYLDYVAITIISDVMPLDNLNLSLLKYGMKIIKNRERYFYELIWNDWTAPTINETSISFNLVPMINAIGRINDANIGVKLFTSTNKDDIKENFEFMKKINEERKVMSRNNVKEADNSLHEGIEGTKDKVIIVRNHDFHEGIVGIIAGKLAERYQRPAYVFGWNEEKGIWKGSARSFANVHLYDLTSSISETVLGFGGHKGAVGLAVTPENWESFDSALRDSANSIPESEFIDLNLQPIECELNEITLDIMETMNKYAPFGQGNIKPRFKTQANIEVDKELSGGLHYKVILWNKERTNSIIGLFFQVEKEDFLKKINEEEISSFIFDPVYSYDLRTKNFSVEYICEFER